jgi:hypothetical protein
MSDYINTTIHAPSLKATLPTGASVSAQLAPKANIGAQLTPGGIIMNDYRLTVSEIERGKRLEVRRGAEVQNMDILDGTGIVDITIEEVV